jgi:hypothetical protein
MLALNQADWNELCQQSPKPEPDNLVLDDFEMVWGVSPYLEQGYSDNSGGTARC